MLSFLPFRLAFGLVCMLLSIFYPLGFLYTSGILEWIFCPLPVKKKIISVCLCTFDDEVFVH